MQSFRRIALELLRQFKHNQLKYNPKPTMAEGTESSLHLTDVDNQTVYHDIEKNEISMLLGVKQVGGKDLPVTSFTESKIAKNFKLLTGVEPVAMTLLGPRDVLLDFEQETEVIPLSLLAFGKHQWEDRGVDISCLMAKKSKLFELYQEQSSVGREREEIRKEKEKLLKEKEEYEAHVGQLVGEIGTKLDRLDRKIEDVPLIPSGIVTPEVLSPRQEYPQLMMAPTLPLFSGQEPTPRDEGTYDQWRFQVRGMRSSCPEQAVRSAIITSVRGEASELVGFVGFSAPLGSILQAVEKRFGKLATTDRLQQDFYQLQQDKGERVQHFAGRLEKTFKKLQEAFPDRYGEHELKERLFHGVNQQTRDSMRFLYSKHTTTYDSLLAAIKEAEIEWSESRTTVRMKGAVVQDKEEEIEDLRKRLDKLTAAVKSSNLKVKKGSQEKSPKGSPKREEGRPKSKGPFTSSAGPYKQGQRPIQCYKCEGWGHGWRECPTKGNVDWARVRGEPSPTENPDPGNFQQ